MSRARNLVGWCGVFVALAASGCAAAYHDYPCGCIPYAYCPPPPLAYGPYEACPTPIARCYALDQPALPHPAPHVPDDWP